LSYYLQCGRLYFSSFSCCWPLWWPSWSSSSGPKRFPMIPRMSKTKKTEPDRPALPRRKRDQLAQLRQLLGLDGPYAAALGHRQLVLTCPDQRVARRRLQAFTGEPKGKPLPLNLNSLLIDPKILTIQCQKNKPFISLTFPLNDQKNA